MPREFTAAVEYAMNSLLRRACSAEELDDHRIRALLREASASRIHLDQTTIEFLLRHKLETLTKQLTADPSNPDKLEGLLKALRTAKQMPFPISLWSVQNEIYALAASLYSKTSKRALRGDRKAQSWAAGFLALSEALSIRLS